MRQSPGQLGAELYPVTPIVRWAGSKRKLLEVLAACVPQTFQTYVEPFAGSACLFFRLCPERALLGDINEELVEFYGALKDQPTELAERVQSMPASSEFYYRLRESKKRSPLTRAARFCYLNRYCYNGVFRTNKAGQFNVPRGVKVGRIPSAEAFYQDAEKGLSAGIRKSGHSTRLS